MHIKNIITFRSGLLFYIVVVASFNLLLTKVALLGTFGYEFAAVNGLLFTILSGLYTIGLVSKTQYFISDLIKNIGALLLIPIIVVIVHSFLTMFCSFWDGFLFYLLIVLTSAVFGIAVAIIIDLYFKRLKRTVFLFVILLIALIPIAEIYFLPQVYFYSPLIGFFPGNIYDEGLRPDWKLFFHQMIILCFSISILCAIIIQRKKVVKYKYIFITVLVIFIIAFQLSSSSIGFSTTFSKLESELPNKIESDRLCLYYNNITSSEAEYIALNQEYYYDEIQKP